MKQSAYSHLGVLLVFSIELVGIHQVPEEICVIQMVQLC